LAVQTAADLDEALETLQEESAGCLLVLLAAASTPRETCDTIATLLQRGQVFTITAAVMGAVSDEATSLRDACLAAGAMAFLPKPVDPAELRAVLARIPAFAGDGTVARQSGQTQ
ncbi:MAG TPA: response regulator, partial [Lamprocystis sp. (in: g-proteobacteria)]|nr:response regulator [Lamprocystis sp. (in: g-proteobacteria)]